MTDKMQAFWDKQAKRYDNSERQFDPVYDVVLADTVKYLTSTDLVLDLGCATGTKTLALAGDTGQIHGIDISAEMIRIANNKKEEAAAENISFSRGTIFDQPVEEGSFDKIISFGVLHLLEEYEQVVQIIYKGIKPGGLFISTTACLKERMAIKNRIEFSTYLFLKRCKLFPLHLNRFTLDDVKKIIEDQGFRIIKAQRFFHGITSGYIVAEKTI